MSMFRSHLQMNKMRRITAWLLMLVCVWMGTGGVLNHTDDELTGQFVPKAASTLHRQTAAAPQDTCAACEWTQGLLGRTLSVCRVQLPLFHLPPRLHSALPLFLARPLRLRPSRAPPIPSTFC
jgi:hypothetical protein